MERRHFIKNLSLATAAPVVLGGFPVNLFAANQDLQSALLSAEPEKVLIILQMHGGNDGLNTVIPIKYYNEYYNLRSNIAIPDAGSRKYITLDNTLSDAQKAGLHPDMLGIKQLYDQGKVGIIQGVSYPDNSQSHFRSRDIWFRGTDGSSLGQNLYRDSGWAGRMLNEEYPNYPEDYPDNNPMKDPLALEIGSTVSLLYHRSNGIPVAISVNDPNGFYNLIRTVGNSILPVSLENTYYEKELKWILDIEEKSNKYAPRLKATYDAGGSTTITYPDKYVLNAPNKYLTNSLAPQLRLIAQLLAGGSKTKMFIVRIGGFDTHANQVVAGSSTYGGHAALLYHISSAMKAFQDDLKSRGLEDRVMTTTYSEFGRRPESNSSYGSDHGSAAPMFVFGKNVKPGVYGDNPDLTKLENGNLPQQNDYRTVLGEILQDFMNVSPAALTATGFDRYINPPYSKLGLVSDIPSSTVHDFQLTRFVIGPCFPNPAKSETSFTLKIITSAKVIVELFTIKGELVRVVLDDDLVSGTHQIKVNLEDLTAGVYTLKIDAGIAKGVNKINVVN